MDGLTLFDLPLARTSDPDTSHMAAQQMKDSGALGKQAQWVFNTLKKCNGATYRELAESMGLANPNPCARRLSGLRDKGLVENGDVRVCEVGGNKMQTWWVSETFGPKLEIVNPDE